MKISKILLATMALAILFTGMINVGSVEANISEENQGVQEERYILEFHNCKPSTVEVIFDLNLLDEDNLQFIMEKSEAGRPLLSYSVNGEPPHQLEVREQPGVEIPTVRLSEFFQIVS
jgi:hypothetical protein